MWIPESWAETSSYTAGWENNMTRIDPNRTGGVYSGLRLHSLPISFYKNFSCIPMIGGLWSIQDDVVMWYGVVGSRTQIHCFRCITRHIHAYSQFWVDLWWLYDFFVKISGLDTVCWWAFATRHWLSMSISIWRHHVQRWIYRSNVHCNMEIYCVNVRSLTDYIIDLEFPSGFSGTLNHADVLVLSESHF